MTPCDAYAKRLASRCAAVLDMYEVYYIFLKLINNS